jgi:hypothetical protein
MRTTMNTIMSRMRFLLTMVILASVTDAALAQTTPARPADSSRTVTIPLAEFNRLVDLAERPSPTPPAAPVPYVLSSAELQVRVERDSVRGTFVLEGDVMRAGTTKVTLLNGGTVLDGAQGDRPLPLVSEKESHAALLGGPGPFAARLDWGGALAFTPGRASFVLPVPPSGTARGTIDLPGEQADVRISPGLVTGRTVAAGRTRIDVTFDPGSMTQVSWSMRDAAPAAAAREVRSLADVLTLITVGESELRVATLVDIAVMLGEPRSFTAHLPPGFELVSLTGNSLDTTSQTGNVVTITVTNPAQRRHQFLFVLERSQPSTVTEVSAGLITLTGVQRERGEVALNGVGTLELQAPERPGLTRIDVRELNPALQALARESLLAAYRYQGTPGTGMEVAFDVRRFGNAGVLAAVAERAMVTTLVTSEGRALTEISLRIQNRAQPFLRVVLPAGASMVSVDVAGASAKPALGSDGVRVPLLRSGFRPSGPYNVTFVYLHDGAPFAGKGRAGIALPRMDIPVTVTEWEVFVPSRYRVRPTGGNAIARSEFDRAGPSPASPEDGFRLQTGSYRETAISGPPMVRGRAQDPSGAALPGVKVEISQAGRVIRTAVTDGNGNYQIAAVPPGEYAVVFQLTGFTAARHPSVVVRDGMAVDVNSSMRIGAITEAVTVSAEAANFRTRSGSGQDVTLALNGAMGESETGGAVVNQRRVVDATPSQSVINLQQRAAGVLPVRIDVPRAGTSLQFVRTLVVDEETMVQLDYRRR